MPLYCEGLLDAVPCAVPNEGLTRIVPLRWE